MTFLDANSVIYFVEQTPGWAAKVTARIGALRAAQEQLAISDLVRMECLVDPIAASDSARQSDFQSFFHDPDVAILAITAAVCDRAARVRAKYRFKPLDSLHLAAAVEYGCMRFLTNDATLQRFPDITVELIT